MDVTRKDITRISVQEWGRPDSKELQMLMLGQMLPLWPMHHQLKVLGNQVTNHNQAYQLLPLMMMAIKPSKVVIRINKDLRAPKSGEEELASVREAGLTPCLRW